VHLATSSGDSMSLSMTSNFGGLESSSTRKLYEVGGEQRRRGLQLVSEKMLLGGVRVGEFSRLPFPRFSTVERKMTALRAPGDKNMMGNNLDLDGMTMK